MPITPGYTGSKVKSFTMNLSQAAGTYDIFTATGDVLIKRIVWRVGTSAAGLTSITASTNDTTPVALLASVLLAALVAGTNLTPFTTPTLLASGKKGQFTIVGVGSGGGAATAIVEFYPNGGDLI